MGNNSGYVKLKLYFVGLFIVFRTLSIMDLIIFYYYFESQPAVIIQQM